MSNSNWLILVDHTTAAWHVIPSLQKAGYKILYLGTQSKLQELSDDYIDESPLNAGFNERHSQFLKSKNVAGVYTLLEHAKTAEKDLAEFLGCTAVSTETLQLSRDKFQMRSRLQASSKVGTVKIQFIPDGNPVPLPTLPFPFIVKPNSGYASGGVQLVRDLEQFRNAVNVVRRLNRFVLSKDMNMQTGVLCEEYIVGPEFSVDALTTDGQTSIFCVCGRGFVAEENFQDYLYYSSPRLPANESLETLKTAISEFLALMNHHDGPSHTEVRYNIERRQWTIIESGLRVGFAGNIGRLIEETTGVPYNALALKSHLKQLSHADINSAIDFTASSALKFGFVFTPATGSGGIISEIKGAGFLASDSRIRFHDFQKNIGDAVIPYPKGLEYLGVIIGVEKTREDQMAFAKSTAEQVRFQYA